MNYYTKEELKITSTMLERFKELGLKTKYLGTGIEKPIKYKSNYSSLKAHHAGYSKTYEQKVEKININTFIKFFNKNQITFYRNKDIKVQDWCYNNWFKSLNIQKDKFQQEVIKSKKIKEILEAIILKKK